MLASNRWSQYIPLTCASKVDYGNGLLELNQNSSLGMRTHKMNTDSTKLGKSPGLVMA